MKLHLEIELNPSELLKAAQKFVAMAQALTEKPLESTTQNELVETPEEAAPAPAPAPKSKGGRPRRTAVKDVDPSDPQPVENGGVQSIEQPSPPKVDEPAPTKPVEKVQEKTVSHSINLESIITMFKLLSYVESREKAFDVLKSFGVNSVHMLPESTYPAVKAKIDSLLPKE